MSANEFKCDLSNVLFDSFFGINDSIEGVLESSNSLGSDLLEILSFVANNGDEMMLRKMVSAYVQFNRVVNYVNEKALRIQDKDECFDSSIA